MNTSNDETSDLLSEHLDVTDLLRGETLVFEPSDAHLQRGNIDGGCHPRSVFRRRLSCGRNEF